MRFLDQPGDKISRVEWDVPLDFAVESHRSIVANLWRIDLKQLHFHVPFMLFGDFCDAVFENPYPLWTERLDLVIGMSDDECHVLNRFNQKVDEDGSRVITICPCDLEHEGAKERRRRQKVQLLSVTIASKLESLVKKIPQLNRLSVKWKFAFGHAEPRCYGSNLMYVRETCKMMEFALRLPRIQHLDFARAATSLEDEWQDCAAAVREQSKSTLEVVSAHLPLARSLLFCESFILPANGNELVAKQLAKNYLIRKRWSQVAPFLASARANATCSRALMWSCLPLCRYISELASMTHDYATMHSLPVEDNTTTVDFPLGRFCNTKFAQSQTTIIIAKPGPASRHTTMPTPSPPPPSARSATRRARRDSTHTRRNLSIRDPPPTNRRRKRP